ncbi:TPA: hypothetical protein N0F65_009852 [Lagenidium giganteum]|uniref:L-aspartate oxidase n=1 Tax=Lagenidium giganteum TaxID=4803 RepID=A0AAV2YP92_9STRA|nr:TPA: hypothetical protein N0F65_009852 [Lagenidium giganteum]
MTQLDMCLIKPVQLAEACSTAMIPRRKISLTGFRRFSSSAASYDTIDCNALIVGCGVAGNAAALRLANRGVRVTMIAAAENPHQSATYYAQGGIIYKSKDDTPALLASDVHRAGAGMCDDIAVQKLAEEGPGCVEELLLEVSKVPFTKDADGELALTLEASHNRARILYKADHTGQTITVSMVRAVRDHPNIELITGRSAFELIKNERGDCVGVLTVSSQDKIEYYRAPFTLLATGGVGDVYKNTSNPEGARGEGAGLAARAGAKLKNMQYVQFHPTTLYIPGERRFLLTEALRGEGAILRNKSGYAFAKDYHPAGELAPRDVVARLILAEMEKQGEACMYLDISHEDADWIENRFPTIYKHCLERGIDMTKEPMPVVPAAHYHCGGIEVDLDGCTSIPGLYAAGEVSCTGVHGANRLASTSLLEGLVWGCASADHFMANYRGLQHSGEPTKETDPFSGLDRVREASTKDIEAILQATQRIMWENVGPLRTVAGMARAVEKLSLLEIQADKMYKECKITRELAGLRNAVRAAKEIALSALKAPLSVGTHYIVPDNKA